MKRYDCYYYDVEHAKLFTAETADGAWCQWNDVKVLEENNKIMADMLRDIMSKMVTGEFDRSEVCCAIQSLFNDIEG